MFREPQHGIVDMTKIDPERLYKEPEVGRLLGVKITTLQNWRANSKGPAWVKIGRACFYNGADVQAFIAAQRRVPMQPQRDTRP